MKHFAQGRNANVPYRYPYPLEREPMTKIAIIGTAGRDKTKPMNIHLWHWMTTHAWHSIPAGSHVVSGGAAWADHLAVYLFLYGHAREITLHLPAPFRNHCFRGPSKSSSSAANWYHDKFSEAVGIDSLAEIQQVLARKSGVTVTMENTHNGFTGMFARNVKVATADEMIAYTFGQGDAPEDGGTKHTWDLCTGKRVHIALPLQLGDML